MGAQKGRDMLLKLDPASNGNFVTVAGLRSRKLAFNSASVNITDAESAGRWRELLAGAGIRQASIAGTGIFKDQQSDEDVRSIMFSGAIVDWEITIPDFGTVTGPFHISSLEYSGDHDGELTFDIGLESAGALAFAVLP